MKIENLNLSKTYSYADYLKWSFEERLELIRGKIFRMSPEPSTTHQRISGFIFYKIYDALKKEKCEVFDAPFDVRLPRLNHASPEKIFTVVQPDICVICDIEKLDEKGCLGAPDLIVEILSPGNTQKEMHDKFEVYEESGVKEYWIVQPTEKVIFCYILNEKGKYVGLKPMTEAEVLVSYCFPKIKIKIKEVFKG